VVVSLLLSVVSAVRAAVVLVRTAREVGLRPWAAFRLQLLMGASPPIEALERNACLELKCHVERPPPALVRRLCGCLRENTSLRELDFSDCVLGARGMTILSRALVDAAKADRPMLSSLQKLSLKGCEMGPAGMSALCEYLAIRLPLELETLDLSDNKLGDDGLITLAQTLKGRGNWRALRDVSLQGNLSKAAGRIDEVADALAAAVKVSYHLRSLSVDKPLDEHPKLLKQVKEKEGLASYDTLTLYGYFNTIGW
jgi:hypothetical protein